MKPLALSVQLSTGSCWRVKLQTVELCISGDGSLWSWWGISSYSGVGTGHHFEEECLPSCLSQAFHPCLPLIKHNKGFDESEY